MTVIPLDGENLWIHSPCKLSPDLMEDIQRLGSPRWLVAPNRIHHLYLAEWQDAFPDAELFAAPGLPEKRSDLDFDAQLGHEPDKAWAGEIDQLIFRGSYAMQEVVFFHRASSTVIVTDLIENFSPDHFKGVGKVLAKLAGIVSPYGKTPLDWRLTFVFGKKEAKRSVEQILRWRPRHLVLAHGECIEDDAAEFIRKSFSWV